MTNRDEVAELADRIEERRAEGEDYEAEFVIDFESLTEAQREDFLALMEQRIAHGSEVLAGSTENVRILQLLFAWQEGAHHRAGVRRTGPWRGARPAGGVEVRRVMSRSP